MRERRWQIAPAASPLSHINPFFGERLQPLQVDGEIRTKSCGTRTSARDEHLCEDGECGRGECDEDPGNDVCNYFATREVRKDANYVEVFTGWKSASLDAGSNVRSDHHFTKRSGDMVYTSVLD
jgi:hypothetical protein